ncbi:hypothetical protein LG047_12865 [Methylocystis sp. WRRC1]|uniref:hypothetical protein n=1 Tax=Methylocystis sp. WRRC1 TaxID=1732014 RepID=UPI001D14BF82|nr:hypothetical protein [Methylocystis sp. WRRC1]MCC3246201.1 hypothetical protein [Methylocystis sp. WRRC1]
MIALAKRAIECSHDETNYRHVLLEIIERQGSGDDSEAPFRRPSFDPRERAELLDQIGEVRAGDGLTELGLDPQPVGELPGLVEVAGSRAPAHVSGSILNLNSTQPELLRAIFELMEDDLSGMEGLLMIGCGGRQGAIPPPGQAI